MELSLNFYFKLSWIGAHWLPGIQPITSQARHRDGSEFICERGHAASWLFVNLEYRVPCREEFLGRYVKVA